MTPLVVSEVMSVNSINSTLPFSNLQLMKVIRHLRKIEEGGLESSFPKIIKESNSSERMNLANSLVIETPKLLSFGHPPMETDNVGHRIDGWSGDDNFSVRSDVGKADKIDTAVQKSSINERNKASSRIEEESRESISLKSSRS